MNDFIKVLRELRKYPPHYFFGVLTALVLFGALSFGIVLTVAIIMRV